MGPLSIGATSCRCSPPIVCSSGSCGVRTPPDSSASCACHKCRDTPGRRRRPSNISSGSSSGRGPSVRPARTSVLASYLQEAATDVRAGRTLGPRPLDEPQDRKSTRLNSSHGYISYAVFLFRKSTRLNSSHRYKSYSVFCLKKKAKRDPACGSDLQADTSAELRLGEDTRQSRYASPVTPLTV